MHDAGSGRHDQHVVKGRLRPFQQVVPLDIALEFKVDVSCQCAFRCEVVDLDRVIDNEIGVDYRIDDAWVAAFISDGVAHGSEVYDDGNAGEVLQSDSPGHVWKLFLRYLIRGPRRDEANIVFGRRAEVSVAESIFQQDADREWQSGNLAEASFFKCA